jgi:hypothetical protein
MNDLEALDTAKSIDFSLTYIGCFLRFPWLSQDYYITLYPQYNPNLKRENETTFFICNGAVWYHDNNSTRQAVV